MKTGNIGCGGNGNRVMASRKSIEMAAMAISKAKAMAKWRRKPASMAAKYS
jgi:hypothetical protein